MDNGSYLRYLNGDETAFAEIVREYFPNLTFFINRYVHDPHMAQDLAIDTFTELIVHPKRYHPKTSLKTYLFAIGRHKALNYVKRRDRFSFTELTEAERLPEEISLEDAVIADARKQAVNAAVARLPEDLRVAVHLIYFEELSYEEAAKVMKKSRKQVYNLMYRAKTALRETLEQKGERT